MKMLVSAVVFLLLLVPAWAQFYSANTHPVSLGQSGLLSSASLSVSTQQNSGDANSFASANADGALAIPSGTKATLALVDPVWNKAAKIGDNVYAAVAFPVDVRGQILIPAGTYVQGIVDELARPNWHSNRAEFQMHFTALIYANGYAVPLVVTSGSAAEQVDTVPNAATATGAAQSGAERQNGPHVAIAVADVRLQVSSKSDILLDHGSQIEMVFQKPLSLDTGKVAQATHMTQATALGPMPSATFCRPVPGTAGTPSTTIPGTPGTPGTPPTEIPGPPGMPPTIIPGTPGTPCTPATLMPGTPGTPGVVCPAPPIVVNSPDDKTHSGNFELATTAQLAGKRLTAGSYQVNWTGDGPLAQVAILQKGKVVASAQANVRLLEGRAPQDLATTRTNTGNTPSLVSLRFANQAMALFFD
jgi:hypothetical protein